MAEIRTVTDLEIAKRLDDEVKRFTHNLKVSVADMLAVVAKFEYRKAEINTAREKSEHPNGTVCPFCDSTVPHYHYHTHDGYVPEPHPEKTGMTGNTKCNHVRFDKVHATYCPDCGMHRTCIEGGKT